MQSKVSVRGQTVIPHKIRQALNITNDTILDWKIQDGTIVVHPLPSDPVRASLGILRGEWTIDEFLKERNLERAREIADEWKE